MSTFADKTVLITGAASGIGRVTAQAFAAKGAAVIVSDINEAGGEETVALIEKAGGKAGFFRADMADRKDIRRLFQAVFDRYPRLDIAVNNAGIGGGLFSPTAHYDDEAWDRVIAINQSGVFFCMKEELRHMQEQGGGAIVNVASVAGLKALPNASAYVASKHAVVGLTKTAAVEYARHGVRVNAICPVFTITPLVEDMFAFDPSLEGKLKKGIPLQRYARPEEMAHAILWLCDPGSGFVTGLCLPMDGGMLA